MGLRIVEKIRLGDRAAEETSSDPELGMRTVPNTPGHDANGFRNASVRPQVEIVGLGDSQTWALWTTKEADPRVAADRLSADSLAAKLIPNLKQSLSAS